MIQRRHFSIGALAAVSMVLTGCMPSMTIEEMKTMMPKRPAELDKLNAFAGEWVGTGEAKMMGIDEPIKTRATTEGHWEGNNWYLVVRGKYQMEGFDGMEAIETWSYDQHSKKYRNTWTDSMGSMGTGVSWIDKKGVWQMRAKSHGAWGPTTMKGTLSMLDDNTMEWEWNEYAFFGLIKTMEMKGTSKRK
jgi:hypothetical protein